ncbi:MAG: acyl-CoA dehydrogenase family protein [Candidatus Binatia bacterium]
MDFGLSDDQELLQKSARDFLARECTPSVVRQAAQATPGSSEAVERRMAEMGWPGVLVPESYGGLALGMLDAAVLIGELGRVAAPGPFLFSAVLATQAIMTAGNRMQKQEWLPKLASGHATATMALLEASDRLDPPGVRTRARRLASGYRISGAKLFVPYAHTADVLITACRTSGSDGASGITLFLVDRRSPGLTIRLLDTIDRTRRVCEVELRNVQVGREHVLGLVGGGWPVIAKILDVAAVALAADALGGAERVLEMSVDYSKTREQFGRPIGSFQAIKHMAAEMVAEVEPARSLLWYAAYAQDERKREATRAASMAKASLCDIFARSANRAVQMHGGIGFTWEHDLHLWFKRAKWNELAFGDPTYHRERVATLSAF